MVGSAWGVTTWMQDSRIADAADAVSLGGQPYVRKVNDDVTWSLGTPLLYANFAEVEDDDQWSGGFDGVVERALGHGLFIGAHGALLDHYAEALDDNSFLSFSGGPYVGLTRSVTERLALTAMVLTEGIATEKAEDTWYVACGGGASYRLTGAVSANLFGLYYTNMDTYTDDEDRDFVEVGVGLEAALSEQTAVQCDISTFCCAHDIERSTMVTLGLTRAF